MRSGPMRRVVVTGLGVVSPLGNDVASVTDALRKGRGGIRTIPEYAELGLRSQVAGVCDIDLEAELSKAFHILQSKLEPLERAVYVLKEVFDFDYKSLQEVLDKKQDHCRQLFCRAKKKLQEELQKRAEETRKKLEANPPAGTPAANPAAK